MLQDLPQDVLAMILKQWMDTGYASDIKHLCEVSKSLYHFSLPYLYEGLVLEPSDERNLEQIDSEPLRAARDRGHLAYTREIEITSKFHDIISDRCIHHGVYLYDSDDEDILDGKITNNLIPFLEAFEDGNLRSLNWDLGICVPDSLLGPSGYFPIRQPNIESMRLVTDGSCPQSHESDTELALSSFPNLKCLSWVGLASDRDINTLAAVLDRASHQLVELNLDLMHRRDLYYSDVLEEENDLFAKDILGIPERRIRKFTALRVLCLSAVSFLATAEKTSNLPFDYETYCSTRMQAVEQISSVFDFSTIRSLKLRFCPGWDVLLQLLSKSSLPIRLTSLEIQSSIMDESNEGYEMIPFLESFEGLEELFLHTSSTMDTPDIWRAALHHKATLRSFVHHHRSQNLDEESSLFETDCDVPDLSFVPEDVADFCTDPSKNPLSGLKLTSVGLCCTPEWMKPIVSAFVGTNTVEVLHMRQSGPDFGQYASWSKNSAEDDVRFDQAGLSPQDNELPHLGKSFGDFAQWIFGPAGILSLRVLAFGDFSYDGRFTQHNLMLCRRELPGQAASDGVQNLYFRTLTADDEDIRELCQKHLNLLEACPVDPLLKA